MTQHAEEAPQLRFLLAQGRSKLETTFSSAPNSKYFVVQKEGFDAIVWLMYQTVSAPWGVAAKVS